MTTIYVGSKVRLASGTFTDADSTPTDPNTVEFKIQEPGGSISTYTYGTADPELVKESTGKYYVDWGVTLAGTHTYRFQGRDVNGDPDGAAEKQFRVEATAFTYPTEP